MANSILHITDLHLNNFEGTDEHLRKRYYKEYIDGLVKCISDSNQKVNIVIISGDFVDQGKTENFKNITAIIEYLTSGLSIANSNICVCIGNHDYKYKEEKSDGSNSQIIREPYLEFAKQYDSNILFSNERVKLELLDSGIYYLSLDSTLGSHEVNRKGKPGNITEKEVDIIVNDCLKEHIKDNSILLVGCHYPIEHFPNSLGASAEEDWNDKHQWVQAGFLRSRINKIPTVLKIWFLGDTHFPDHLYYEEALFVMTGRFGGSTRIKDVKHVSHIPRQCKIINLDGHNKIESVFTYNYKMETHIDSAMSGNWIGGNSEIRELQSYRKEGDITPSTTQEDTGKLDFIGAIDKISNTVEEKIIERIKHLDLYSFGRFKTSNDHTSLGWISINQLLNEQKILSSIVSKSVARIEIKSSFLVSETAIIGLDFWGAIIGSQVSVRSGIKHYCIATRGHGQYHTDWEKTNNLLDGEIPNVKGIIIFIDVVSSGGTINKIIEAIKSKNNTIEFHLISVISNNSQLETETSSNLKSIGTFCLDLKIPVLNNSDLPDETILPPNIDFSIKSE